MRTIEEFKVTGTFNDEQVNGKLTGYTNNIKKSIPLGLKTAVLKTFEQAKEKISNLNTNIENYINKKPQLRKNLATGAFVVVMAASFTGCSMKQPQAITDLSNYKPAFEQVLEKEQTAEIEYTINYGDTLSGLVSKYTTDITNEVNQVCKINNISDPNRIQKGDEIILHVPISKLENFGYEYTIGEVNQWDAMNHFVYSVFSEPEVDPDNFLYSRNQQIVVGNSDSQIDLSLTETPLLIKAASIRHDLKIMTDDQYGFYSEEDIKSKEKEIDEIYSRAVKLAEEAMPSKKYTIDYLLEPPIIVNKIEQEKGLSK